jgi:lipopolysaccharide transport system ATP-binding protein
MNDDVLVKVDNVSKRFCRSLKRSLWYGLQDLGSEIGGRRHGGGSGLPQSSADVQLRPDEFWAVKDVSFELRRGECLGLIGRNGAGKTTLLRMLNGLIKPDTGRVELKGRIGAIIALGVGFNPVLTGRENIYTQGSILGLTNKQISELVPDILDFAEIGDFIDSPFQTYSSGMQVRLGFSVAAKINPDILLVDEVLAVGDTRFRAKCLNCIGEMIGNGTSVILVSHSAPDIERICPKSIYLSKKGLLLGNSSEVMAKYNQDQDLLDLKPENRQQRSGNGKALITSFNINGNSGTEFSIIHNKPLTARISYDTIDVVDSINASISFSNSNTTQYNAYTLSDDNITVAVEKNGCIEIHFPNIILAPGAYKVNICLMDQKNLLIYDWKPEIATILVESNGKRICGGFAMTHNWNAYGGRETL